MKIIDELMLADTKGWLLSEYWKGITCMMIVHAENQNAKIKITPQVPVNPVNAIISDKDTV